MSTAVYALKSVSVAFAGHAGLRPAVHDISVQIGGGEIVGVVGPSGVGKTTLLRVLGGLLQTTSGTALFHGEPLHGPPRSAVMVFQDYANALLPWRTVERNVALGLEGKVSHPERRRRVARSLELVGLEHRAADHPWQLSGGMAQRVQIARALALEPTVLLMDEPFGALDAMTKAALQDVLLDVQGQTGATVVFITHDLDEALYLSDRVLVLTGTPGTLTLDLRTALPRPRDQLGTRESARFLHLRRTLGHALRAADVPV